MDAVLFGDNRTKLSDIPFVETPAAKGVNAATGLMEAMIESAQQDMKLFEAMIAVDAAELKLKATGVVSESAITALHEGAIEKIKKAIVEGIKWLVGRLRAAKDAVLKFIHEKLDADYRMVNKYKDKIMQNADKCVGITIHMKHHFFTHYDKFPLPFEMGEALANYKDNKDDAIIFYAKQQDNKINNYIIKSIQSGKTVDIEKDEYDITIESKEAVKGLIVTFLGIKKRVDEYDVEYSKYLKQLDQQAANINHNPLGVKEEDASKIVSMFNAYKTYAIDYCNRYKNIVITELSQCRAIMQKFIGAVNKVDESMVEFYIEMSNAEFQDLLENTYGDPEEVGPEPTNEGTTETVTSDEEVKLEDIQVY